MAAITEGHLVTKAPSCSHHLFLFPFFLFASPGSTDRESVEFLLWRNAELWHFLKLLEAAQWRQFKEPGAFLSSARLFLRIFRHPWPSYYQYEVTGMGEMMMVMLALACPGDCWVPNVETGRWKRLWWSLWLSGQEQSIKKTKQSCHSVIVFFSFFCTNSWTPDKIVWICVVGRSCACDQLHLFLTDE